MTPMKSFLFMTICILLAIRVESSDGDFWLGKFSTGDLSGWKEQSIGLMKPKTIYKLTKDADKTVLMAHSTKSASGQMYKLNLDPKEYSTLKWSWKIDHIIKKGDERTKDGDDFSARVYVLFPRGFFSKTRAICYVWANKLPKGEHVISPFSPNIITVAADSGDDLAGRWTFHQRNIYEDYKLFFGEEPPRIGAIALMTDTDNTGDSTVGYYGDISLQRSTKVIDGKQNDQKIKEKAPKEQKQKDQPPKGIKNNNDKTAPTDTSTPAKTKDDTKNKEPNNKEQPHDKTNLSPVTAPPPSAPQ